MLTVYNTSQSHFIEPAMVERTCVGKYIRSLKSFQKVFRSICCEGMRRRAEIKLTCFFRLRRIGLAVFAHARALVPGGTASLVGIHQFERSDSELPRSRKSDAGRSMGRHHRQGNNRSAEAEVCYSALMKKLNSNKVFSNV